MSSLMLYTAFQIQSACSYSPTTAAAAAAAEHYLMGTTIQMPPDDDRKYPKYLSARCLLGTERTDCGKDTCGEIRWTQSVFL